LLPFNLLLGLSARSTLLLLMHAKFNDEVMSAEIT